MSVTLVAAPPSWDTGPTTHASRPPSEAGDNSPNSSETAQPDIAEDDRAMKSKEEALITSGNAATMKIVDDAIMEQEDIAFLNSEGDTSLKSEGAVNVMNEDDTPMENGEDPPSQTDGETNGGDHGANFKDETEFMAAGQALKDDPKAEWALDSSDSSNTSDSSSDSDDSSSDSDASNGSDTKSIDLEDAAEAIEEMLATAPRTSNEKPEPILPKPSLTMTEDTKITLLGKVYSVVEPRILIQGANTGEVLVLDVGSVACLSNKTILGVISDVLGQTHQPFFVVGFEDFKEVSSLGITVGTEIFYVNDHVKIVMTKPLRTKKGYDTSNYDDEEPESDQEFSDDEKEQEYRREKKRKRQENNSRPGRENVRGRANLRGQRGSAPRGLGRLSNGFGDSGIQYPTNISYDDNDDDGEYKKLARPDSLPPPPVDGSFKPSPQRARGNFNARGRGSDPGRSERGNTGRNHFNGRGNSGQHRAQDRRGNNYGGSRPNGQHGRPTDHGYSHSSSPPPNGTAHTSRFASSSGQPNFNISPVQGYDPAMLSFNMQAFGVPPAPPSASGFPHMPPPGFNPSMHNGQPPAFPMPMPMPIPPVWPMVQQQFQHNTNHGYNNQLQQQQAFNQQYSQQMINPPTQNNHNNIQPFPSHTQAASNQNRPTDSRRRTSQDQAAPQTPALGDNDQLAKLLREVNKQINKTS